MNINNYKCCFCKKDILIEDGNLLTKISSKHGLYCYFCLRNNYREVDYYGRYFLFSMRNIIAYYFWHLYYFSNKPILWVSEIKDYIETHKKIGLKNPVFNYDEETYTWIVDFKYVGDEISLEDVKTTIVEMLASFNVKKFIIGINAFKFYDKFKLAIDNFYKGKITNDILIPNFEDCGNVEWVKPTPNEPFTSLEYKGKVLSIDNIGDFSPNIINENIWNKTIKI